VRSVVRWLILSLVEYSRNDFPDVESCVGFGMIGVSFSAKGWTEQPSFFFANLYPMSIKMHHYITNSFSLTHPRSITPKNIHTQNGIDHESKSLFFLTHKIFVEVEQLFGDWRPSFNRHFDSTDARLGQDLIFLLTRWSWSKVGIFSCRHVFCTRRAEYYFSVTWAHQIGWTKCWIQRFIADVCD